MLTENREFNEIYEQYKNLILKAAYLIQAVIMQRKILLKTLF